MLDIRDHGGKFGGLGGGAKIKSRQQGRTTMISNQYDINVTISAIDLPNSIVKVTGTRPTSTNGSLDALSVQARLTSSTNLRFTRNGSAAPALIIEWEVIVFEGVTIQQGQFVFSQTTESYNLPITSVNTSKCILFFTYEFNTTVSLSNLYLVTAALTSATTLGLARTQTGASCTVQWYLVEFK